ncbi:MAG: four helix bundle protein [Candidatus Cloacimonetes bacterium]|nr:four helix bundle protein [Candidatus Cloacimonadota bacterium]
MKKNNIILEKSFDFALEIIKVYKYLRFKKKEYVMSKQLLKAGTSIGANCEEADAAQSHKDFIAKMSISIKEAKETRYWIRLLLYSDYLDKKEILGKSEEIIRILTKILKTARENEEKNK